METFPFDLPLLIPAWIDPPCLPGILRLLLYIIIMNSGLRRTHGEILIGDGRLVPELALNKVVLTFKFKPRHLHCAYRFRSPATLHIGVTSEPHVLLLRT